MLSKDFAGQQVIEQLGEDTVKKLINDQITKSDSPTKTQTDLFGMFDKLIDEFTKIGAQFTELLGKMKNDSEGKVVVTMAQNSDVTEFSSNNAGA